MKDTNYPLVYGLGGALLVGLAIHFCSYPFGREAPLPIKGFVWFEVMGALLTLLGAAVLRAGNLVVLQKHHANKANSITDPSAVEHQEAHDQSAYLARRKGMWVAIQFFLIGGLILALLVAIPLFNSK